MADSGPIDDEKSEPTLPHPAVDHLKVELSKDETGHDAGSDRFSIASEYTGSGGSRRESLHSQNDVEGSKETQATVQIPPVEMNTKEAMSLEIPMSTMNVNASNGIAPLEDGDKMGLKYNPRQLSGLQVYLKTGSIIAAILAFHVYLVAAVLHDFTKAEPIVYLTIFVWLCILYSKVLKKNYANTFNKDVIGKVNDNWKRLTAPARNRMILGGIVLLLLAIFLIWDTWGRFQRLSGLAGVLFYFTFMVMFSNNRRMIRWRTVGMAFTCQFFFALAVLRWPWGQKKFQQLADLIVGFLDYAKEGYQFVYGFAATPPPICGMSPIFVFTVLQVLIYFNAFVSLLYYLGVIQFIMKKMAWLMQKTLATSATESVNAVSCVFLGMTEGPMLIAPYIPKMTASELHAVMTSGFSCIAGSLFAAYISFGACPVYLLSSSIMSAPGSLACSKLLYPEEEESQLKEVEDLELTTGEDTSVIDALSNGAVTAVGFIWAIAANLIVFMAGLALVSAIIGFAGELIGFDGWTLDGVFSYLFFPLAYLMGVNHDLQQTLRVASLMGTKTTVNEFVAYMKLGKMVADGLLDARSQMIATFALCGFSNFGSTGMVIGLLGSLAPAKKPILSKLVLRCLLAGSISCFLTATIAGILTDEPIQCLPAALTACVNMTDYLPHENLLNTTKIF